MNIYHAYLPTITLLLLLSSPAMASAPTAKSEGDGACRSYIDVNVTVMPVFEEAKYNTSVNLAGLQALSSNGKTSTIPHYESITLGLASYERMAQFYIPIIQHLMPDGSFCARVQHLDARIGFKNVTVYVASEFKQGTCAFQAVLEHEQKHVEVNRRLLQEYAPIIKQRLHQYLKINGMFRVQNQAYADKLLREKVTAIVEQVAKEMSEENVRRQRLIDTPQEYAKNNTVCNGYISKVVRSQFGKQMARRR